jgi:outer membrane protein assembly factor BamB
MRMSPDDVEALLHRFPRPAPSSDLRLRVLGELARNVPVAAPAPPALRRRAVFYGAAALAASLATFAAVLWIVLPHSTSTGSTRVLMSTQEPPVTDRLPFKTNWELTVPGKVTALTPAGAMLFISEASPLQISAVDTTLGRLSWTFAPGGAPPPAWPPVVAQGLAGELQDLNAALREANAQIDDRLKESGPGPGTTALQKKRNAIRERLRVASACDHLYLVYGTEIYALERTTGALKWKRLLGFTPTARPLATRNYVFLADGSAGRVRVLDVERKGQEVTSYEGPVAGGLAYADPYVVFGGRDRFLRAFKIADGTLVWKLPVAGAVRLDPTIEIVRGDTRDRAERPMTERVALVASGRVLTAVGLESGLLAWQFDCGAEITSGPVRKEDAVYVGTADGALSALDLRPPADVAGRLRWKCPGGERFVIKTGGLVYVQGGPRTLIAVRESTGEVAGRYSLASDAQIAVNPADGLLYLAGPGGRVVCLADER